MSNIKGVKTEKIVVLLGEFDMTKMLVVDDEIEIGDFLKSFFVEKGFEVETANNGKDALEIIDTFNPQIMLCDVRMPGMSGIEVLRQAKQKDSNLIVIMITAIDLEDVVEEARTLGAVDYITKPFSLSYLEKNVIAKIMSILH